MIEVDVAAYLRKLLHLTRIHIQLLLPIIVGAIMSVKFISRKFTFTSCLLFITGLAEQVQQIRQLPDQYLLIRCTKQK